MLVTDAAGARSEIPDLVTPWPWLVSQIVYFYPAQLQLLQPCSWAYWGHLQPKAGGPKDCPWEQHPPPTPASPTNPLLLPLGGFVWMSMAPLRSLCIQTLIHEMAGPLHQWQQALGHAQSGKPSVPSAMMESQHPTMDS